MVRAERAGWAERAEEQVESRWQEQLRGQEEEKLAAQSVA
jgi:hypothetical protein